MNTTQEVKGFMRKIISIGFFISLIFVYAPSVYAGSYSDINDKHWASPAIIDASEKGILSGYPDGTFRPNDEVTYGEFIKMSYLAGGNKDLDKSNDGNWAIGYYKEALNLGYFEEDDIPIDVLNKPIPRNYMALLTSNVYGKVTFIGYEYIENDFDDVNETTKYKEDIIKIYALDIIRGFKDPIYGNLIKTFKPDQTLTRAEAAQIIYKLSNPLQRFAQGSVETVTTTSNSNIISKKTTITIKQPPMGTTPPAIGGYKVELKDYWRNGVIYTHSEISYDVKLGDYGIQKIEKLANGRIVVYSTVCYELINMYIDNIKLNGAGILGGGNYYIEDGYYVYIVYYPEGQDGNIPVTVYGKTPSLILYGSPYDENNPIYRYTDVVLP